jgi:hypothetical protein
MKKLFFLGFTVVLTSSLYAGDALDLNYPFEKELKRGYIGKVFVNPRPEIRFDGTGEQARSGKGAIGLDKTVGITMDCPGIQGNEVYRFSVYMKSDKPGAKGTLRIVWWGKSGKKPLRTDVKSQALTGDYAILSLTGQAPEGTSHVYLRYESNAPAWIDDAAFQTVVKED